jgi:thymidylate kinase
MVKQEPGRWVVVDAGRNWEKIQEELRAVIFARLKGYVGGETVRSKGQD